MSEKPNFKFLIPATAALALTAISETGGADPEQPFRMSQIDNDLGDSDDAGEKEGNRSGDKDAEASCGADKEGEGSCGGDKEGEGKCGGSAYPQDTNEYESDICKIFKELPVCSKIEEEPPVEDDN